MAKRVLLALVAIAMACHASANPTDSTQVGRKERRARTSGHELRNPLLNAAYQFVKEFSRVDTLYVEPQHYNFTVMLQNTNTYEIYHLANKTGQEIVFVPKPSVKLGP